MTFSKRRESIVCSTDGGERRIVDRRGDKESENRMHGARRRPKIFLMRDTASLVEDEPKFENDLRAEGDILDLRPTTQQGKEWNLRDRKNQRKILADTQEAPEICHRMRQVSAHCFVLSCTMSRSGEEPGSCAISVATHRSWDDAKGGWLVPVLVRNAREEEMQYVKKHAVYESRLAGRTRTRERPSVRT